MASELDSLRKIHRIPGLAAAVVRDGETVWAEGFGVAEVDEGVPVTPDTPFWTASVTKTFVGLTFLQMANDGVVSLDDRMSEVPDFDGLCADLAASPMSLGRGLDCDAPITVRDLLSHTAAYDHGHAFSYNPILFSRLSRYLEWTVNDSTEIEGGLNELARQIEARILEPAGMPLTSAGMWDRSKMDVVFDLARGYGVEEDGDQWWWVQRPQPKRAIPGGAGIVSTALDLGRYLAALDAGTLAPPATMDALLTPPRDRDGRPLPYAVGWYVQEVDGERVAWHSGWDPEHGASALLMWLPERRLGFAVLANGEACGGATRSARLPSNGPTSRGRSLTDSSSEKRIRGSSIRRAGYPAAARRRRASRSCFVRSSVLPCLVQPLRRPARVSRKLLCCAY